MLIPDANLEIRRRSLIPALVVPSLLTPASIIILVSSLSPALEPDLFRVAIPWQFHPGSAPCVRVEPAVVLVVVVIAAVIVVGVFFQHHDRRKSRYDYGFSPVPGPNCAPNEQEHPEQSGKRYPFHLLLLNPFRVQEAGSRRS